MREIKFRGWNGKRWTREYTLYELLSFQLEHNGLKENWVQYTGLKDKNGKEIYEGDIIKLYSEDNFSVEYNYDAFKRKSVKGVFYPMITDYGNMEVIGNIYENPELLQHEK